MKVYKSLKVSEVSASKETVDLLSDLLSETSDNTDSYQQVVIPRTFFQNWLETLKEDPAILKENPVAWKGVMRIAQLMSAQKVDLLLMDLAA